MSDQPEPRRTVSLHDTSPAAQTAVEAQLAARLRAAAQAELDRIGPTVFAERLSIAEVGVESLFWMQRWPVGLAMRVTAMLGVITVDNPPTIAGRTDIDEIASLLTAAGVDPTITPVDAVRTLIADREAHSRLVNAVVDRMGGAGWVRRQQLSDPAWVPVHDALDVSEAIVCDPPGRRRDLRNVLAEAFIVGLQVGADEPELAGDGGEMYQAFRDWIDNKDGL